jgi:hypothetical protein
MQINDANRKLRRLKRVYESMENDKVEGFVFDIAKRLATETKGDGDQSKSKSRSVRHRKAKTEIHFFNKEIFQF